MSGSIFSHFDSGIIVEQDECHTSYKQKLVEGEGIASVFPVLPGIEVIDLNFHASHYIPIVQKQLNILEIAHCLEGRAECRMSDGCLQYIGEGDLFMNPIQNHSESIELPLGYFRGIVVAIDVDVADSKIIGLFSGIPINICELANRFFANDECFLIQAKEEIQHIFYGMYAIPVQARSVYYRLKVQELLLYLHYFDTANEKQKRFYTRQQVDIVKQIQKRITGEPGHRFTIEELANEYCISPTTLKSNFKGVYGVSIAAYMKEYRIRQSLTLLRHTQKSVAEIALEMGYESQSKFGVAFKEIMKITPLEYRKKVCT